MDGELCEQNDIHHTRYVHKIKERLTKHRHSRSTGLRNMASILPLWDGSNKLPTASLGKELKMISTLLDFTKPNLAASSIVST